MKYVFWAFMLFMFNSSYAQSSDATEISNLLQQQTNDWNKGNIEAFMQGYWKNDSLLFIGKNGVTYGWQQTLENYKKSHPDTTNMGKLNFVIIKIEALSPVYYNVIGKWHLTRSVGNLQGHFTLLIKKIHNKWSIVQDHSS